MSAAEIPILLEALDADPANWSTRRYLAEHYLRTGETDKALSLVSTAPGPPDTEDHALFAALLAAPYSLRRAQRLLDSFLVHFPSSPRAHYLKGKLFGLQGDLEKSETHYRVAAVLWPEILQYGDQVVEVAPIHMEGYEEPTPVPMPSLHPDLVTDATQRVRTLTPRPDGKIEPPAALHPEVQEAHLSPALQQLPVSEIREMEHTGSVLSPSEAVADSNTVLISVREEGDGAADDPMSLIVGRQASAVAAMSTTLGTAAKPEVQEVKRASSQVSAIAIAVIAHLVVLAALGLVVLNIPTPQPPEIYASAARVESETEMDADALKKVQRQVAAPSARPEPVLTSAMYSDIAMPDVATASISNMMGLSSEAGMDFGMSFADGGGGAGMGNIPPSMAGRCSMGQRMARLTESGASAKCEAAVRRALTFLKENQNENGSFGVEYPVAMTGLSILAFLGHCETPDSLEYGSAVVNATLYLLERGRSSNSGSIHSPNSNRRAYENAIATYALAEIYTMTKATGDAKRIPRLESVMRDGVKVVIDGQIRRNGGWDYNYDLSKQDPDSSVSGWQFQALKAAYNTGESIGGLERALDKGIEYFKYAQSKDGGFSYRPLRDRNEKGSPQPRPGLGGVGALTFEMWKMEDSKESEQAFDWLAKNRLGKGSLNIYDWYYTMQAYFLDGGDRWKEWNDFAMPRILEAQISDGSFAKAPEGHGPKNPRDIVIYKTCLCTLMLEVYYRYLPTTQKNLGKG